MKSIATAALAAALFLSFESAALAEQNFSDLTNDEMAALRNSMKREPEETREAFRKEWQNRVARMTPKERAALANSAGENSAQSTDNEDSDCQ
jgi:hypothetical protein